MFTFGHFSTISNECVHCNIFISQLSTLQFFHGFFGLIWFGVLAVHYCTLAVLCWNAHFCIKKMYAFHLGFHHRLSESNQMENTENLWVDFFSLPLLLFFTSFKIIIIVIWFFFYLTLCYACSLKSYSHQINLYAVAVAV